jgi:hypothetical protein
MKTIQIKWDNNQSPMAASPYYSPNPAFAWFGKKQGDAYLQITGWHGCRETFANELRHVLVNQPAQIVHPYTKMTTRQLRILVKFKSEKQKKAAGFKTREGQVTKWMKESVRMVNIFEKYMGWPLTRLSRVSNQTLGKKKLSTYYTVVFAIQGSAKWLRAPQLLSLYLLIIRLGRFYTVTKKAFKSMDDLNELSKAISVRSQEGQANGDAKFFRGIKPHLLTVLDNRQTLFFYRTAREHFHYNDGFTGITKLVNGTADTDLVNRFNEAKRRSKEKG